MTDNTQSEALDLADWLDGCGGLTSKSAAAELRRQHARIADLEAIGAGGVNGPLMTPTPTSGAADLPEALRVPLDSLHADAGYLCGRLLNGSLTQEQVVESIRRRIDAAKLAALTAQAISVEPAGACTAELRRLHAELETLPVGYINRGIAPHTKGKTVFHEKPTTNLEERWWSRDEPVFLASQGQAPALDRDRIREIFMAHGFTVKEGQTDLKQYVYDAAEALLRAARAQADSVQEDAALCENDLYALTGDIDPMAFCQNLACEIERAMRIFPNVPPLEFIDPLAPGTPHDPR